MAEDRAAMGWTARGAAALVLTGALTGAAGGAAACGAGELALPGTAGCVRLGGLVRAESAAGGGARRIVPSAQGAPGGGRGAASNAGLRAGARADLDARVPTAYGPLRAYVGVAAGGVGRR